jgi:hypothetical protein
MGTERAIAISRRRRGFGRAAVFLGVLALLVCGCGRSGHGAATDSDKAADVEILNGLLTRELTAVAAYDELLPLLRGQAAVVVARLRGQDQAHLDAITKAIRGVGGETDAEAGALEAPGPKTQEEALLLAYEEESDSLGLALDAPPHVNTPAPRVLVSALAASHAQHLVVLRQLLGVPLSDAVPHAFEDGAEPPPPTPPVKAR